MYVKREYRIDMSSNSDLESFEIKIKETDLFILVEPRVISPEAKAKIYQYTFRLRNELENYIKEDPGFYYTLDPHMVKSSAPDIARNMTKYANMAGVGPMAAVAGGFAEMVGKFIEQFSQEVIVENGGDVYLKSQRTRIVGVFAGKSPFSNQIGIKIKPSQTPLGICTSSGTVGPSLSFGEADAAIILSKSTFLSDAVATAAGNRVITPDDFSLALEFVRKIKGVEGAVLIKGDKMALWGSIELVPLKNK